MKSPNTARGARAFHVTSTATVVRATDVTYGACYASPAEARFYWDRLSNSIQPLTLHLGSVCHE
ncbi:hypothetical protein SAMN04488020_11134 [Palleronia marisminoris]|uniref:Uncharacterized protein n=1 Tax=Palleronia marisminoris TaxID=315423 RepID=A0A1Y5TI07_9RHOB|nr:hypothetical protein SAMN04488020_11134 [Palleronia marisminoris]SLN62500.1 hypothetical protein PAM7066_03109 [Palleronia marisminoris]